MIITEEDMIEIFIIEEEKEVDLEVEVMIGIIGIIGILEEIQEVEVEVGVEVLIEGEGNFFFSDLNNFSDIILFQIFLFQIYYIFKSFISNL